MNGNFAAYATSTAFSISLSGNAVKALYMIYHSTLDEKILFGNGTRDFFIGAFRSLERRGLAYYKASNKRDYMGVKRQNWNIFPYYLTDEGKLVYQLCLKAGLFDQWMQLETTKKRAA